ncbi:unnamed protein product [Mytilus edulis]|uniref:Uncharacterized protein n=1 Tax=Mytilus edulis TaxID=6550 RepID=A0A8S3UMN9_MYTED|nr:unnamed protein product [Mytilus edulis]
MVKQSVNIISQDWSVSPSLDVNNSNEPSLDPNVQANSNGNTKGNFDHPFRQTCLLKHPPDQRHQEDKLVSQSCGPNNGQAKLRNLSIPLLVRNTSQKKITKTKVLWERRDEEKYRETILNELLQKDLPTLEIDQQIDIISNSLLNAQQQSIPSKITQLKGPKWKATPEVTVLLRMCKVLYNKWADLGKPIGHPLSLELKTHKKKATAKPANGTSH